MTRKLRRQLGVGVPKRQAAAVLGVTVQALDRWGRRIVPDPTAENFSRLWDALAAVDARPAEGGDFKPEEMPVPFVRAGLIEAGLILDYALDPDGKAIHATVIFYKRPVSG